MTKYILILLLYSFSLNAKVKVAIIDTGVELPSNYQLNFIDKDSKDFNSFFSFNKNEINHGTHVASTILGLLPFFRNGEEYLVQNNDLSILSLNYYNSNSSGLDNLDKSLKALAYAIEQNVQIINYSGGGPEYSLEEFNLLKRANEKNIIVISASGNSGENIDGSKKYYPAAYNLPNMIIVGAANMDIDISFPKKFNFSNYGQESVTVFAPGKFDSLSDSRSYMNMKGTSQATAVVTNLVVAIMIKYPDLKISQIKDYIIAGVNKSQEISSYCSSGGIISFLNTFNLIEKQKREIASLKK